MDDPCVALAGRLGERGITRLRVRSPGRETCVLEARSTDLPGLLRALLASGLEAVIIADEIGPIAELSGGSLRALV